MSKRKPRATPAGDGGRGGRTGATTARTNAKSSESGSNANLGNPSAEAGDSDSGDGSDDDVDYDAEEVEGLQRQIADLKAMLEAAKAKEAALAAQRTQSDSGLSNLDLHRMDAQEKLLS